MMSLRLSAPEGEEPYRWDWVSPSLISRHDPNVVYLGGNRLFISRDREDSFTRTEDLTRRQDRDTLEIMGVRGTDIALSRNDGTSSYGEIVTISESPLDPAVLWVGTDDGNVQVSQDGGRSWNEVSSGAPGLPDGTYVSRVLASAEAPGTAYVTFDAHRDGDFRPYVYRAEDFGARWTALHDDLPSLHDDFPSGSVNVIVEHPDNAEVLFIGTEHHVFASTDRGDSWARFPGLPTTSYDDMVIHPREKDLVLGTHGRSIIVIDDVGPLARYGTTAADAAAFYEPGSGTIMNYWKDTSYRAQAVFMGENPADGTAITYRLGPGSGPATLTVRNGAGEVVRVMGVPSGPGLHRVNWDLRHGLPSTDQPEWAPHDATEVPRPLEMRGPFVSPGVYTLDLSARGLVRTRHVSVRGDPIFPSRPRTIGRGRPSCLKSSNCTADWKVPETRSPATAAISCSSTARSTAAASGRGLFIRLRRPSANGWSGSRRRCGGSGWLCREPDGCPVARQVSILIAIETNAPTMNPMSPQMAPAPTPVRASEPRWEPCADAVNRFPTSQPDSDERSGKVSATAMSTAAGSMPASCAIRRNSDTVSPSHPESTSISDARWRMRDTCALDNFLANGFINRPPCR